MENLIYPDGLVVRHNGPTVSVSGETDPHIAAGIHYDYDDNHVKVNIDFTSGEAEMSGTWSCSTVFMGPPIESVSMEWSGNAVRYYYPRANILLKGGPGITTDVAWTEVADMFNGNKECLEVRFSAAGPKPQGLVMRGVLSVDCKMPDWVIPH